MGPQSQETKDFIRWVVVLPGAMTAFAVSLIPAGLVAHLLSANFRSPDWVTFGVLGGAGLFAFVFSGAKIAPKHNDFVAVALSLALGAFLESKALHSINGPLTVLSLLPLFFCFAVMLLAIYAVRRTPHWKG